MNALAQCARCQSCACNGETVACLGCGVEQCFGNGLGRGACSVCRYGILPGWSSWTGVCGYKGCGKPSAFNHVPGSVKRVCLGCAGRPKIASYVPRAVGGYETVKISLADHVANALKSGSGRGIVQAGEVTKCRLVMGLDEFIARRDAAVTEATG